MKKIYLFLWLFIIFSCSETPIDAPLDHNSVIEGIVNSNSNESLISSVKLYRQGEINHIGETQSDLTGYYMFKNLNQGDYQLNFSADDYEMFNLSLSLASNQSIILDTISLQRIMRIEEKEVIIDGVIDNNWEASYVNTLVSSWGVNNELSNLYIARDNDSLYIAIDGQFSSIENCINIYIDKDYGNGTGLSNFSNILGGEPGDNLRKNISTISDFGADLAFTVWALDYAHGIFNLYDESNIEDNKIEFSNYIVQSNVIEIAIAFDELYENGIIPNDQKIALVIIIGGGGDTYFSDDSIPQIEGFEGNFTVVFSRSY